MKKKLKLGAGFFIFINILIFYYVLDCRFYSRFSYRTSCGVNPHRYYIYNYMDSIQDSIIDWKPLMKKDSLIKIISINNKKKSLEFYYIEKDEKDYYVFYYVNGDLYRYHSQKAAELFYDH